MHQDDIVQRNIFFCLIAQHEHTMAEIMKITGVSRQTVFTYRDTVVGQGVEGLLKRGWAGARKPAVRGALTKEFLEKLEAGKFRQARDAQAWIKKRTRKTLTESGVRQLIRRLGGKLKVPRKSHVKKDAKAAAEFRATMSERIMKVVDQAGFHMKQEDRRVSANIRVLPLPPYCPELNPAEWFGRVVKAPMVNRIYQTLEKLGPPHRCSQTME